MRDSAKIISEILTGLAKEAKIGINLLELEEIGCKAIEAFGATSINKGYTTDFQKKKPFPSCFCLSVNDEITHTPARDYVLADGDLLTIDAGILFKGFAGDAAITVPIGEITKADAELMKHAKNALYVGIDRIKAGVEISEVGLAIQEYTDAFKYTVCRPLMGHLINEKMHGGYKIPMCRVKIIEGKTIPVFKEGDVVCIEPHLSYRDTQGYIDKEDGWTVRTKDEENSVMFEHMVLVLKDGYEILTTHISL